MSTGGPGGEGRAGDGSAGGLRRAALIALAAGAVGSVALTVYAGRHNPFPLVTAGFALWVLSPFVLLGLADWLTRRWPAPARAGLYGLMLVLVLVSLAVYAFAAARPTGPRTTPIFVVLPPLSWVLTAVVVAIVALTSRRR